ncbi:hypothetical protein [Enterovirga rhinocerotis]|uniref:Uncharacterized protein n=1 Tax=Enterovirga rhinocerotis TaxID=1339210 RepID=A0A4R7C5W4_9HYPH|nr:hypothetical protein [Enterovirga rhinocerotis]TDR93292.1 hypothetical protein EV668_0548 [Enterovirga rhinocerotis]
MVTLAKSPARSVSLSQGSAMGALAHPRAPAQVRAAPRLPASLMRMGLAGRLAIAGVGTVLLWAAIGLGLA